MSPIAISPANYYHCDVIRYWAGHAQRYGRTNVQCTYVVSVRWPLTHVGISSYIEVSVRSWAFASKWTVHVTRFNVYDWLFPPGFANAVKYILHVALVFGTYATAPMYTLSVLSVCNVGVLWPSSCSLCHAYTKLGAVCFSYQLNVWVADRAWWVAGHYLSGTVC